MFVLETPEASCFPKMSQMFELDTATGKTKFRQFLDDSKTFLDDARSNLTGDIANPDWPANNGFAGTPVKKRLYNGDIRKQSDRPYGAGLLCEINRKD